jgi:exopolyphosphatase/guanosine-5'-triphosphate,3'-diphosphate pyrophosphatase
MLWLERDARLGELRWFPRKKRLELRLTAEAAPLFGEVAEARFRSLCTTLQAEPVIRTPRG